MHYIVTTADQYKVVYDLSIDAILNFYLNDPQSQISRYANISRWISQ